MLRIAIVANKVTPYRVPVFQRLARSPDVMLHVIFCTEREPNRLWDLPPLEFNHTILRERFATVNRRYIHNNLDTIPVLFRFSPDVVITCGFNPTQLYAFGYAAMKNLAHVPFTDGTFTSEQTLSKLHRAVRRFVYARSDAFVSASVGGQRLYESYGIAARRCFKSCLAIDNDAYSPMRQPEDRRFDFIFCGRMEPVKNPLFALIVAMETAKRRGRKTSILFAGSGSEEEHVKSAASLWTDLVDTEFHGFAAQNDLPALYQSARIFLFPTQWDPWGIVANEACAAGLPVMTSPHAGVVGELVLDGENGFVCELDVGKWVDLATMLLSEQPVWQRFSTRSLELVKEYNYDSAAAGLLAACQFALSAGDRDNIKTSISDGRPVNPGS